MIATITVADYTKPAQNLFNLLSQGNLTGYTVVPSGGVMPALTAIASVSYLSIQASYKNGSVVIYKGDENTANDGTRQGKEMLAGDTDVGQAYPYTVNLNEIFIRASANGGIVNVEIHFA